LKSATSGRTVTAADAHVDTPHWFSHDAKYVVEAVGAEIVSGVPVPTSAPPQESEYQRTSVPLPPNAVSVIVPPSFAQSDVRLAVALVGAVTSGMTVLAT
jgi:hypothetical protein